jgi:hypothetical protein
MQILFTQWLRRTTTEAQEMFDSSIDKIRSRRWCISVKDLDEECSVYSAASCAILNSSNHSGDEMTNALEKLRNHIELQTIRLKESNAAKMGQEEKEVKDILMNAVAKMKQEVEQEVRRCDRMGWNGMRWGAFMPSILSVVEFDSDGSMISHIVSDTVTISLCTVHLYTAYTVQVRKLSGTSAKGYSRDGLENRLNNAYFELDKKIEVTLQGCSLAESARKDFQEVRTRTVLTMAWERAGHLVEILSLSPCVSFFS